MPKNNKFTRARAAKLAAKQTFIQQTDGTEVLASKEARQKLRRWSFLADVKLVLPAPKNEDGTPKLNEDGSPMVMPPMQTRSIKLDSVSYADAKQVRQDCLNHKEYLHRTSPMFKNAEITVRALPHETVSHTTYKQLMGYRDMAAVLDRTLGIAITLIKDMSSGKSTGAEVVALDDQKAKELLYSQALNAYKVDNAQATDNQSVESVEESPIVRAPGSIELTDSGDEPKREFIPEIVLPESIIY